VWGDERQRGRGLRLVAGPFEVEDDRDGTM
jgi:hypothetical protein